MKILVTGGAGFIGSNLVSRLLFEGHEVTVVDNESSEAHETFHWESAAENHRADIAVYEDIRPLFEGVEIVFHIAAEARIQPSIINPLTTIRTNSLGTATVLQCSREAGVSRVVYSSTSSAYGRNLTPNVESQIDDCLNPYSVSKVNGEKLCLMYWQLFGLQTITLRYFNVYGPRQPIKGQYAPVVGIFQRQNEAGLPLTIVGSGEQRRDFTHVADVVDANLLAGFGDIPQEHLGQIFNVGTGRNYSINDLASLYGHPSMHIPERPGEAKETLADNSKARQVLGWEPTRNLEDWITHVSSE